MTADKITPEEKLLKMIESPGSVKSKIALGPKNPAISIKELGNWFKGLHVDKNMLKSISLSTVNKGMMALCAILTTFFIFNYITSRINLDERLIQVKAEATAYSVDEEKMSLPAVDISSVIATAKKSNMFTFLPVSSREKGGSSKPASQEMGDLKLVGILWSSNPQAMIENAKENKTYLLNSGDKLGEFKVNKILKDKVVILDKDGEEWDLR